MKLRIKGDSLRLRLSRTEVAQLVEQSSITETTHFEPGRELQYAVVLHAGTGGLTARFGDGRIEIVVSTAEAETWAVGDAVGLYGETDTGNGSLALSVEKDFACLDRSDAENADTFPNPNSKC